MAVDREIRGQRFVEVEFREVDAGQTRHARQMQVEMLLGLGRFHAGAVAGRLHADVDDRIGEEQHLEVVGIAPVRGRLFANLVAIGLHAFDTAAAFGDDRVGPARSELRTRMDPSIRACRSTRSSPNRCG
jgi:hypothetical protein